uniref:Uncharacterized protein n=1 Tax=Opuntia streptacantha TaxID=393608 RepID=A0A7C9DHC0_OPUST
MCVCVCMEAPFLCACMHLFFNLWNFPQARGIQSDLGEAIMKSEVIHTLSGPSYKLQRILVRKPKKQPHCQTFYQNTNPHTKMRLYPLQQRSFMILPGNTELSAAPEDLEEDGLIARNPELGRGGGIIILVPSLV